jgi:Mlc titration factor MtfA (ptsG expression regulator)
LPTLLDTYGAESPAEFFAVATECFFSQPVQLRDRHPQLYEVLRDFYNQDSAARLQRSQG